VASCPWVNDALKIARAVQAGATLTVVDAEFVCVVVCFVEVASARSVERPTMAKIVGPSARLTLNQEVNVFIKGFLLLFE
jgi:hypothetical protein